MMSDLVSDHNGYLWYRAELCNPDYIRVHSCPLCGGMFHYRSNIHNSCYSFLHNSQKHILRKNKRTQKMTQWYRNTSSNRHFCAHLRSQWTNWSKACKKLLLSPLGKGVDFHLSNLKSLYLKMLHVKIDWNWPSGSGVEFFLILFNVFLQCQYYLHLKKGVAINSNKDEIP